MTDRELLRECIRAIDDLADSANIGVYDQLISRISARLSEPEDAVTVPRPDAASKSGAKSITLTYFNGRRDEAIAMLDAAQKKG